MKTVFVVLEGERGEGSSVYGVYNTLGKAILAVQSILVRSIHDENRVEYSSRKIVREGIEFDCREWIIEGVDIIQIREIKVQ